MSEFVFTPRVLKETVNGISPVSIEDELFANREIFLTSAVNADTMVSLLKQLMYLHSVDAEKEITLYINSPGGEVQSGLVIYDYIHMISTPVRTVCIGTAASMGAILFLAGERREMMPNSRIMIHDPAFGDASMAGMKPAELAERLESLKQVQDITCKIIADTAGKSMEEVKEKTRKDSYFNAAQAVEYGLATSIIETFERGGMDVER